MSSPFPLRLAAAILAGGLLGAALVPARAADFEGYRDGPPPHASEGRPPPPPHYGPPPPDAFDRRPPPPPRYVEGPAPPPPCRTIVRRHVDPYGDEVIRRVRVCDGPPGGYGPPPWRGPRW